MRIMFTQEHPLSEFHTKPLKVNIFNRMKKSIQFGAGNIGRGFIGALLRQSGYEVLFADINAQMINAIQERGYYTVFVTDHEPESFEIDNVTALDTSNPLLVEKVAESDIITTAVGFSVLPKIAPVIARGIEERAARNNETFLNIIACENGVRATSELKKEVLALLSDRAQQYSDKWIGYVDCSVDRIVPPVKMDHVADVSVERFYEWNIDNTQIKGELLLEGVNRVDNLSAYIERKLFTLNTGHAIIAYLGYMKGHDTIEQSIADPDILRYVLAAMKESGAALAQKFGMDIDEHIAYCEKIIKRFRNYYLNDKVNRIGRDPLRKLAAGDRLISPLTTAYGYGLPIDNLLLGIGAALHFQYPGDPESSRMQEMIREVGLSAAIEKITGIEASSPLNMKIVKAYKEVATFSPLLVNKIEIISTSGIEARLVTDLLKKAKEYNYDILLKYI